MHGWVLMTNHYHFFLETPEANLVAGMQWLQNSYTRRFNTRHRVWGRLFGDRYKAVLVEGKKGYFYETLLDYEPAVPPAGKLMPPWQEPAGEREFADRRGFILRRLLAVSDLVALMAAWGLVLGLGYDLVISELGLFAVTLPLWLLIASGMNLYHMPDRRFDYTAADEIGPIALALTVWSWVLLLIRAAVLTGPVELLPSIGLWAISIGLLPVGRGLARAVARHSRWYLQPTVVVGTAADVRMVSRRIARHPEFGLELIGTIELDERLDRPEGPTDARVFGVDGNGGAPVPEELIGRS